MDYTDVNGPQKIKYIFFAVQEVPETDFILALCNQYHAEWEREGNIQKFLGITTLNMIPEGKLQDELIFIIYSWAG